MRSIAFAAALCFASAASLGQEVTPSPDASLVRAALGDFVRRTDTMSLHRDGVVLIERETSAWTMETIRYFSLGRESAKCPIARDLYEAVAVRNPAKELAAPLVAKSPKWRLLAKDEAGSRAGYAVDKSSSGERVKTLAVISRPGYSAKADAALVLFHFRWSMHSAIAQYLLRKEGSQWKIGCSELMFYP